MKKMILSLAAALIATGAVYALEPIKLNKPDIKRGKSAMEALSERKSVREYSAKELTVQDLSDLLWAANGITREDGRTTNPTAMNKQDIKVYVVLPKGTYLYNNKENRLDPISEGDHRQEIRGAMPALNLLIVADDGEARFAGVNAGYVSQNIYIFCAANGMGTVAAAGMDHDAYKKACKWDDKQKAVLQHPVGYLK